MKYTFGILLFFIIPIQSLTACDFCNCYFGINPYSKNNNIGIRNHYSVFSGSHHTAAELQQLGLSSDDFKEQRIVTELHGRWLPLSYLQVDYTLPYVINLFSSPDPVPSPAGRIMHDHPVSGSGASLLHDDTDQYGIGDPLVMVQVRIIDRTSEKDQTGGRLLAGGGIKFPAGRYQPANIDDVNSYSHMPGTGSWDYLLNATYIWKKDKFGVQSNGNYMITGINKNKFQYGNKVNLNVNGFYQVDLNGSEFFPSAGLFFENAGRNEFRKETLDASGGNILYGHAGADWYYKRLSVNIAAEVPVLNKINTPQPAIQYRFISGVTWSF